MYVTRYRPLSEMREIQRKFFENYPTFSKMENEIAAYTPQVNTREGEYAFHLDVDLPGVKKEDIKVDVKEGQLIITGERNFKEEVKEEDYYKVETRFGKFSRMFTLPDSIDVENITANCENGVLEVTLPKLPEVTKIKSIEIK